MRLLDLEYLRMSDPAANPNPLVLKAIYLREQISALDEDFNPLRPGQRLQGQFKSTPIGFELEVEDNGKNGDKALVKTCTYLTNFEFKYRLGGADTSNPQPNIESLPQASTISAKFCSVYSPSPGVTVREGDEFLAAWGNAALVHQWPYWRELCHAMMTRMQLPVVMVPILAVPSNMPLQIESIQRVDKLSDQSKKLRPE